MIGLKCIECSCTIPPDATKCPNCGNKYAEASPKSKIPANGNGGGITVGRIAYSITCPFHGKISVAATIAAPLNRCPFC